MLTADILVIGAGPAGMAAAVAATQAGRRVTVLDDNPSPGGQIWRGGHGTSSRDRQARTWFERFSHTPHQLLSATQVISVDPSTRTLLVETPAGAKTLRFDSLVLATGARELLVPFPGWTLPGVLGVGGLQAMVKSGMPVAGKRIVVAGSGPLLLAVAAHLKSKGAHVALIAEQASSASIARFALGLWRYPSKVREAVALRASLGRTPYRPGSAVVAAHGEGKLSSVTVIHAGQKTVVPCDLAAVAYGLVPNIDIAAALGCTIADRAVLVDNYQQSSLPHLYAAGECTGVGGVDLALIEGRIAGYAAAGDRSASSALFQTRTKARRFVHALDRAFALRPEIRLLPKSDTIVCRCEDVTLARLRSMPSFRAAKLHTRCGMGPCQGRVCGPAVHLLFGWNTDSVRPPTFPATIESLITQGEESSS